MAYITGAYGGKFNLGRVGGKSLYEQYKEIAPTSTVTEEQFNKDTFTGGFYSFQLNTILSYPPLGDAYIIQLFDKEPIGACTLSVDYTRYDPVSIKDIEKHFSRITDTQLIKIAANWYFAYQIKDMLSLDPIWVTLSPVKTVGDGIDEGLVSPIPVMKGGPDVFNLVTAEVSRGDLIDRETVVKEEATQSLLTKLTHNPNPTGANPLVLLNTEEDPLLGKYYLNWDLLYQALYGSRRINTPIMDNTSITLGETAKYDIVSFIDDQGVRHSFGAYITFRLVARPNWLVPVRFKSYALVMDVVGFYNGDTPMSDQITWLGVHGKSNKYIFEYVDDGWCTNTISAPKSFTGNLPGDIQNKVSYFGNSERGGYHAGTVAGMLSTPVCRTSLDLTGTNVEVRTFIPDAFAADDTSYDPNGGLGSVLSMNRSGDDFYLHGLTLGFVLDINYPY